MYKHLQQSSLSDARLAFDQHHAAAFPVGKVSHGRTNRFYLGRPPKQYLGVNQKENIGCISMQRY